MTASPRVRIGAAYVAGVGAFAIGGALAPPGPRGIEDVLLYARGGAVVVFAWWTLGLACFAFGWHALRRERRLAIIVSVQLALGLALLACVQRLPSSDVYAYRFYGETLLHGANPFVLGSQLGATQHPAIAAMVTLYGNPPIGSAYGPVFLAVQAGIAALLGVAAPLRTGAVVQRLLALAAFAATTALVPRPRRTLWALNPFLLFEFALGGHNDALMLALIACAVRARNAGLGGLAIAAATGVKAVALAAAFALPRAGAIAAAICGAAAVALLGTAQNPLLPLATQGGRLGPLWTAVRMLAGIAIAIVIARMPRRRAERGLTIALALVALVPVTHPWYGAWFAFAALWAGRARVRLALTLQTALWPLALLDWY
jgi:hypothetical protein